jgi:arabinogalactan oligomer/maltooligosaccharide transport system permease protein
MMRRAVPCALLALWFVLGARVETAAADDRPLRVWHAYTGAEEQALKDASRAFETAHPGLRIELLAIAYGAYAGKLESAIPAGTGPDVFIDSHERLSSYLELGLLRAFPNGADVSEFRADVAATLVEGGERYGLPLSTKAAALFVNTRLMADPPGELEELLALRGKLPNDAYPLAFATDDAYFLAAFLHAFGGELVGPKGEYAFEGAPAEKTLALVLSMLEKDQIPAEASTDLVKKLFVGDRALAIISGPWFAADVPADLPFRVVPLPTIRAAGGARIAPYLTVEAAFLGASGRGGAGSAHPAAVGFSEFLAVGEGARIRGRVGRQIVAAASVWQDPSLSEDPLLRAFRDAAQGARPMSTRMRAIWEPAQRAIRKVIRRDTSIPLALAEGKKRHATVTRPLPKKQAAWPYELAAGAALLVLAGAALARARHADVRSQLRASLPAYAYVTHALIVIAAVVVLPLFLGALTSFYAGRGEDLYFVGLTNYADILTNRGEGLFANGSFWAVLVVTLVWTAANLALHVGIGVGLALLLHAPARKLKPLYRVLLVLPWAVPSYVTALAWKGMFHRQFGAMNAILEALGAEPIGWMDRWITAFSANLATNVWLGFPFMMVVTLGALTSIPADLYEAAEVDGASRFEQFRFITLPLLRPVLAPAIAMGAVWTFNMFNVVFLVSGGEPDGSTEILVSEAYRWAFTRSGQYGYAAAYAVLIFFVLLIGTRGLPRLAGVFSRRAT